LSKSKEWFRQGASLSQQLAEDKKDYVDLAGSDPKTSQKIQNIKVLGRHGMIDLENNQWKLIMDLLNGKRMALFATSPHTNEITKMGLQMPKAKDEITEF